MKQLIPLIVLVLPLLAACDAATRYDTGAVVLDVSEPQAFSSDAKTTPEFVSAYEAIRSEDFARAEALLDQALTNKPRDPYALLAMGAVHERTGRFYSASDYYRSAARYGESSAAAAPAGEQETEATQAITVASVARENLARMTR